MKNTKKFLLVLWMALLLLPQTTYALKIKEVAYDLNNCITDNTVTVKINLEYVIPGEKLKIKSYYGGTEDVLIEEINNFNQGQPLVEGWNMCILHNIPTGMNFMLKFISSDTTTTYFETQGNTTLLSVTNVNPKFDIADIKFYYNGNERPTTSELTISRNADFENAISLNMSKYFNSIKFVPNGANTYSLKYVDLGNFTRGEKIYFKIKVTKWWNNGIDSTTTETLNFLIPTTTESIHKFPEKVFSIYPNPITEYCVIETISSGELIIIDLTGKIIQQTNILIGKNQIDLSNLPKGIYLARISGQNSFSQKILKL